MICANCHIKHTKTQLKLRQEQNFQLPKRKRFLLPKDTSEVEQKTGRPEQEELYELVKKNSFVRVGKMYGVTPMTVINWCQKQGIPKRRKLMEELK